MTCCCRQFDIIRTALIYSDKRLLWTSGLTSSLLGFKKYIVAHCGYFLVRYSTILTKTSASSRSFAVVTLHWDKFNSHRGKREREKGEREYSMMLKHSAIKKTSGQAWPGFPRHHHHVSALKRGSKHLHNGAQFTHCTMPFRHLLYYIVHIFE